MTEVSCDDERTATSLLAELRRFFTEGLHLSLIHISEPTRPY